jgi:Ras-related protein Rab-5C
MSQEYEEPLIHNNLQLNNSYDINHRIKRTKIKIIEFEFDSDDSSNDNNVKFKCILLGAASSGKTSIVCKYLFNQFMQQIMSTIGIEFMQKDVMTKYGIVTLDLWDTAGQERYESLMPMYYRKADIALIVYDIKSQKSYLKAEHWVKKLKKELEPQPVFILIANKYDLLDEPIDDDTSVYKSYYYADKPVDVTKVNRFVAKYNLLFFECSAKTSYNINKIFKEACEQAYIINIGNIEKKKKLIKQEQKKEKEKEKSNNCCILL